MTPLDVPVLFGLARLDIPHADTGFLHSEGTGEREFGVALDLYVGNETWEDLTDGRAEFEIGVEVLAGREGHKT
jgi:hypothetical protein